MTRDQVIAYGPVTAIIIVLAVFLVLIDSRIWGHTKALEAAVAQATATPTVVVVIQPVSLDAQLGSLRNQVSGGLPSFADFRSEMALPAPVSTPEPIVNAPSDDKLIRDIYLPSPQGATVTYRLVTLGGSQWFEGPNGQIACNDVLAGTVQHWEQWPDWMRTHMAQICTGA